MHPNRNRNRKPGKNASCIFSAFLSLVTNLSDFVPGLELRTKNVLFVQKKELGRKKTTGGRNYKQIPLISHSFTFL